jgi:hypothetical protein
VTKVDRLPWSLPDARNIVDNLTCRQVRLQIGSSVQDPDPVGRLLFNVLAMVARRVRGHLVRTRTREGMKIAKAKDRLRGKQPKLSAAQEAHLVSLHRPAATQAASSPSCSTSPAQLSAAHSSAQSDKPSLAMARASRASRLKTSRSRSSGRSSGFGEPRLNVVA